MKGAPNYYENSTKHVKGLTIWSFVTTIKQVTISDLVVGKPRAFIQNNTPAT